MSILDLFVTKEKIQRNIDTLKERKKNLHSIISKEVNSVLKERYPDSTIEYLREKCRKEISAIEEGLYKKYYNEIDMRLNNLYLI